MEEFDYDVCIIGAGPAGFAAAMRCWDFGSKVCLVERGPLGGAGVHHGVLSSKTLWELSKDYLNVLRKDRGYTVGKVDLSYEMVIKCVEAAAQEKVAQMSKQISELSEPSTQFPGSITLVHGTASFNDPHTVNVCGAEKEHTLSAKHFILATGSRPRKLDDIPVDGFKIVTSDHIMDFKDFPKSMVILGAGVVGCEFATIFANYGKTKVYLIDRADRILPFEDEDISHICSKNLEAKGVTIHHRAKLLSMQPTPDGVSYTIEHHTGARETIEVQKALISVGRLPNTDNLNLKEIGLEMDDRGFVEVENTTTSVKHIHAVGDISKDMALVNIGEIEGRFAAENIHGKSEEKIHYNNLSSIMFLDPEVAAIGINEIQAQEQKIPYIVATYDYSLVNRAIAMRSTGGYIKLLVSDDEDMKMLGMRALGVHASTTIEGASLIIRHGRSARELGDLIHPHPAITEALQDCVRMLTGNSIYKPHVFKSKLRVSKIGY
jgi:dihydrolipoamide dehydrogenase